MTIVPDTTEWIRWLQERALPAWAVADGPPPRIVLTAIALQELWAGVPDAAAARDLEALTETARRHHLLLAPTWPAWVLAGRTLRQLARTARMAPVRLRTIRNDVLLAATAVLEEATVLTRNERDFRAIQRVLPVRVRVA